MIKKLIFIAVFVFSLSSCEDVLLHEEYNRNPEDVFNALCNEYDRSYGAFEAKGIDWDSLRIIYRAQLGELATDAELYAVLCGLIAEINDGHADMYAPNHGYFRSWSRREKRFFTDREFNNDQDISNYQQNIGLHYFHNNYEAIKVEGWTFFYGMLNRDGKQFGYLSIPSFGLIDFPRTFIQSAVESFADCDGLILDLRFNGGGSTESFMYCLNSFAAESKVFLKSKFKNGPGKNDFTKLEDHEICSHENALKNVPVAILMNAWSASSTEHFILGMKSQTEVITVGDTSCGAFSSVKERLLPNGWKIRLGGQVIYTPEGEVYPASNGKYIEGIGIAPDFYAADQYNKSRVGVDVPLNLAMKKLSEQ